MRAFQALSSLIIILSFSTRSHAQEWVGGHILGDFWNVVDNWAAPGVPTGFARISNGGTATISGAAIPSISQLRVADKDTGNGTGTLIINGNLTLRDSWFAVARGRGTAGTAILNPGGVVDMAANGGGQFRVAGENNITGGPGDSGNPTQGTFIQNGGLFDGSNNGNLNATGNQTHWGNQGAGTVNIELNSGTMNTGDTNIGENSSFTTVTQGGGHTMNVTGWFTLRGDNANSHDTWTSTGGAELNVRENFHIGQLDGGGQATLTMTDSYLTTDYDNSGSIIEIGGQVGAHGAVHLTNTEWVHAPTATGGNAVIGNGGTGELTITDSQVGFGRVQASGNPSADAFITVNGASSVFTFLNNAFAINGRGTFTQNDGYVQQTQNGGWFNIADQAAGSATYTLNGGRLRTNGGLDIGGRGNAWFHANGGEITAQSIAVGGKHAGTGVGTLNLDGSTVRTDNDMWIAFQNNSQGTVFLNTGTLDVGGTLVVGRDGNGLLEMATGTRVESQRLWVGEIDGANGTLNQAAGSTVIATQEVDVSRHEAPGTGIYNFDGGTLITNRLRVRQGDGATQTFNWGNGTLRPLELTTAQEGTGNFANYYDILIGQGTPIPAGGANFPEVMYGDRLDINLHNNRNLITGNGALQDSTLLLGNLYQLSGITRFNQVRLDNGGDLDLAATNDTLEALTAGVDFLRAFGSSRYKSYGSLVLVDGGNGGSTIVGGQDFANFTFAGDLQAREFTGTFTGAANLPLDNWYLEYTANDIIFHYHLHGQLPEPNTVAYLGVGMFMITMTRRVRRERAARRS